MEVIKRWNKEGYNGDDGLKYVGDREMLRRCWEGEMGRDIGNKNEKNGRKKKKGRKGGNGKGNEEKEGKKERMEK